MARPAAVLSAVLVVLVLGACGSDEIKLVGSSPMHRGAELFVQRCAGCHTLGTAGTHGSSVDVRTRERNDGPNFDARCEDRLRVLYAIRNGGFSGATMPQNIVVGEEATAVAEFVAKYSGSKVSNPPTPGGSGNQRSSGALVGCEPTAGG